MTYWISDKVTNSDEIQSAFYFQVFYPVLRKLVFFIA